MKILPVNTITHVLKSTICKRGNVKNTKLDNVYKATMSLELQNTNPLTMNNESIWYLDCCATEHMTPYVSKINNFKKTFLIVQMANEEKIQAEGKGDITVQFSDRNGGLLVDLTDVLFVPNLVANILSVGKLVEKGLKITFISNEARISKVNGEVILIAFSKNRLYEIEEQTLTVKLMNENLSVWHRRFGHFNNESIKPVAKNKALQNISKYYEEFCPICTLHQMKSSNSHCSFRVSATRPLELIHSDIVGPVEPTSQGGSKYFVSFIDDYSRHTVVFPMKSTIDVLFKFDDYRRLSENSHGMKILTIRTGSRVEYTSNDFKEYLGNHRIEHQLIIPDVPQQNLIARHVNQKLLNMTKGMIKESNIPENLWADALVTACYVINKCPSIAIYGQIPEELWTGRKVYTKHLRVFGCRASITLNCEVTFGDLDFNVTEFVFIGYSNDVNSYKLWERNKNVFFIADDVNFDESVYPCKSNLIEGKVIVNDIKSNIMTIKVENEANESPIKFSNTTNVVIVYQTEKTEDEAINYKFLPKEVECDEEIKNQKPQEKELEYEKESQHEKSKTEKENENDREAIKDESLPKKAECDLQTKNQKLKDRELEYKKKAVDENSRTDKEKEKERYALNYKTLPKGSECAQETLKQKSQEKEVENENVLEHEKSKLENEISSTEENASSAKNKNRKKNQTRRFKFPSEYFVKRKIFPLSNYKQKLIKSYRKRI